MKVLIAPDSFKGSISAQRFIEIVTGLVKKSFPFVDIDALALADGGEGSLDSISGLSGLSTVKLKVHSPHFQLIDSWYLYDKAGQTAYIELALASGYSLADRDKNVVTANTYGTGELILDAIGKGAKTIVLFIGGSASNDAGLGIARALGYRFVGTESDPGPTGKSLTHISEIIPPANMELYSTVDFLVASDVNNPFYGPDGAAYTYAPQKGAGPEEVGYLDKGLRNISDLFIKTFDKDISLVPGAGAAGGVGGGMMALFGARIVSGSDLIFNLLGLEDKISAADIIITGEGKIDSQTLNNKLIFKLSQLAGLHSKKVYAICGYFDGDEKLCRDLGIEKIYSLAASESHIPYSIANAEKVLKDLLSNVLYSEIRPFCIEKR